MVHTHFKRWREKMGLTLDQAAETLGMSRSQIANWDSGEDRVRKVPIAPPLAVRIQMRLLAEGQDVKPWPE